MARNGNVAMWGGAMADILQVERRGDVEIATLNRPESLNALDEALTDALNAYFGGLADRADVRVVILRGAGRAFCAGLDIKAKGERDATDETPVLRTLRTQTAIGNIYRKMRACPQPIIALAQGAACGGGLSLLLAADIRLGAPTLKMNAAYIKIGLGGCDMASSYFLPRLVGASMAAEMILTGRFIHAPRALACGLISEIVAEDALLDAGMAMAEDMLLTAPWGLRLSKQALGLAIDAPSLEAAMAVEDRQQVILSATQDHGEAMRAFIAKRPPQYTGR
ncbi:MAG: enoyl-CoA hydratase/isomerase family protein [Sphingopyxis sp.]